MMAELPAAESTTRHGGSGDCIQQIVAVSAARRHTQEGVGQPAVCKPHLQIRNMTRSVTAGGMQSAAALQSVREAFEAQGKAKTEKKPAVKRHAAGQTWCAAMHA